MASWPEIKAGIFAGESGGDYDALFGFSNRPGGRFAGTRVTDMTVDEAIQFADPRGPYAQWVKGQIGRVATPMGGFQVVGSTLQKAKEWAGLTGNEPMTAEIQNRLGQAILANQGTGAWEGYKGPRSPRPASTSPYTIAEPGGKTALMQGPIQIRHPPNPAAPTPAGSVGGYGLPPLAAPETAVASNPYASPYALNPADAQASRRDKGLQMMAQSIAGMGGGGQGVNQMPAMTGPAPGGARVDQPNAPLIDPQQSQLQRQQLAAILARLNQGSLV